MVENDQTPSGASVETVPRTAEAAGTERLETMREMTGNVKEAIGVKWDAAKARVSKAGKFLGRLGLGMLGADVAVKNAAVATREAGLNAGRAVKEFAVSDAQRTAEDYRHVSGAVKESATKFGNQTKEAWGRAVERKDQIMAAADAKVKEIHGAWETKRQETRDRIANERHQKQLDDLDTAEASLAEQLQAVKGMILELQAGRAILELQAGRGGVGVAS